MKWLHLSDLHFDPLNAGLSTSMLRDSLPNYLKNSGIQADHLFFTGDFRHAAHQDDSEATAQNAANFLLGIAKSVGITDPHHIHIVPGNHDLTRGTHPKDQQRLLDIRRQYKGEKDRQEGYFTQEELDYLLGRFTFFRRVHMALGAADVWTDALRPLHPHACYGEFNLVYMNTAITCGTDDERGNLVIGSKALYEALRSTRDENPDKPVIVLAHHSPQYFSAGERHDIENIFRQFSDVTVYLCGDAHRPWSQSVNMLPQFTAGCLVQESGTEVVFYTGELRGSVFLPPKAHRWDKNLSAWGTFPQLDARMEETLGSLRTPFFLTRQAVDTVSNLDRIAIRLTPHFTGRDALLDAIHNAFQKGNSLSLTQTIEGLGGVGKTQLALKYAYLHRSAYEHIWWIDASTELSILEGYKSFLQARNIPMDPQSSPQQYIGNVREWLNNHDKWLLVFDNADVFTRDGKTIPPHKVLQSYMPSQQAGTRHILITSRYKNWQRAAKCLDIDVFSPEEARDFLCSFTGLPSDPSQQALAEKLGYLPLALEQAGAYMNATGKNYGEYLALFSRHSTEMLKLHLDEEDPRRIVFTTWNISRDQITKRSALQLLALLAFFAPDNIEMRWLQKSAEHMPDPLRADIQNDLARDELMTELLQYSLVTLQQGKLSLHRLVQRTIKDNLAPDTFQKAMGHCLAICNKLIFFDFSTLELRSSYSALQPHILSILDASDDACLPERRADLYMFLGSGANEHADYENALKWYKKALAIREKVLGKDHPDTATTYNNIAGVYSRKGEYDIALEWYEKALAIREKVLGKDHPDTATTYNNIAGVYSRKGEYDIALEWYICAFKIFFTKFRKFNETMIIRNNILHTYKASGKTENFENWLNQKMKESSYCSATDIR